jgi:hypothetical protein
MYRHRFLYRSHSHCVRAAIRWSYGLDDDVHACTRMYIGRSDGLISIGLPDLPLPLSLSTMITRSHHIPSRVQRFYNFGYTRPVNLTSVPSSLTTFSGVRRYKYMHPQDFLYHARWCPVHATIGAEISRYMHVHACTSLLHSKVV